MVKLPETRQERSETTQAEQESRFTEEELQELASRLSGLEKLPGIVSRLVEIKSERAKADDDDTEVGEATLQEEERLELEFKSVTGWYIDLGDISGDKSSQEKTVSNALLAFFEASPYPSNSEINRISAKVPAIELASGGEYDRDALKIFPDGRILLREIESNYDVIEKKCRFVDPKEATEILEGTVKDDTAEIKKRTERRNKVQAARDALEMNTVRQAMR